MSARSPELNLLPKEIWEKGIIGQLLGWTLSTGRYVVVFTELVVIGAFLYRFGLDRTLSNLQQSLKNKQEIINSYSGLETNFRLVQSKLNKIKAVSDRPLVISALNTLSKITPPDAVFTVVAINKENVVIEGRVASQSGLATILNQSQALTEFSKVILENVKSADSNSGDIEFKLVLTYNLT